MFSQHFPDGTNKNDTIVTIGTFDGVHIGHQKILHDIVVLGKQLGLTSTVLTLFPHPRMVLHQDSSIKLLNTINERKRILQSTGVERVEILEFTKDFAQLSAEDYVKHILVDQLSAKVVVIGYDHHFGKNRSGNIEDLKHFGDVYGFQVKEIQAQQIEDVSVSSTKIRKALHVGNVEMAKNYLGYPYSITGRVIEGDKIGRTLGYPTANIKVIEDYKLIPKDGVYVVQSFIDQETVFGMMNIGSNPTIRDKKPSTEVHFFNFNKNLYGKKLTIKFLSRLREELKFDTLGDLEKQLSLDEEQSKQFLRLES